MTSKEKAIINELDNIIAYCDVTRNKATELRKELGRLYDPTSPRRGRKPAVSPEEMTRVIAGRRKFLNKKALRQQGLIHTLKD